MRPSGRVLSLLIAGTAVLAGCADQGSSYRPAVKPDELTVNFLQPVKEKPGVGKLHRARISTKSGEIQILEPDGSVSEMKLDGDNPDAFATISELDLANLNLNLQLDFRGMPELGPAKKKPTSQELAMEAFAARTRPMLPVLPKAFKSQPEMFRGAKVEAMNGGKKPKPGDMVKVDANLKRGVDADVAFAYATCALAGWAKENGTSYARHIMTDQQKRNGELEIGAYFTLSDVQPMGLKVMKSDETLQECKDRGIPAT
ncbi:hypothetical protein [Paracoccus aminophilus]|uniref:Lipoprotein n=1 Tax=Paracoccus aminophilus JCM 7686 TaxID=1367847 RepID=S5Y1J7_PARAH|nr:hypothetical protein [Paracoccus aminophilus]AGT09570.1 hypothetical protein JCM7686_2502 [Paracoccus aminophilus JCM 7686]